MYLKRPILATIDLISSELFSVGQTRVSSMIVTLIANAQIASQV